MSLKLYLHRDFSTLSPAPPADATDYAYLDWPTMRAMDTIFPTNPVGFNVSGVFTIGSVRKRHGVGRWAYGPLAAGSTLLCKGMGVRFGATQTSISAQSYYGNRLKLYTWRPRTQAVGKMLWSNRPDMPLVSTPNYPLLDMTRWTSSLGPTAFRPISSPQVGVSTVAGWAAFDVGATTQRTARWNNYNDQPLDLLAGDVVDGDYLIFEMQGDVQPSSLGTWSYGMRIDGTSLSVINNFASNLEFWVGNLIELGTETPGPVIDPILLTRDPMTGLSYVDGLYDPNFIRRAPSPWTAPGASSSIYTPPGAPASVYTPGAGIASAYGGAPAPTSGYAASAPASTPWTCTPVPPRPC